MINSEVASTTPHGWREPCLHLSERTLRDNLVIVLTMARRLQDTWSITIPHSTSDKRLTGMTENVLSLRKHCTELLGIADEPGFSSASAAIKCWEVLSTT